MMDLEESWRKTREHLLEARRRLPVDPIPEGEDGSIASFEEYLNHNELQLAMEELEAIAGSHSAPFSFWRQMRHAAEQMQLEEACVRYSSLCLILPLAADLAVRLESALSKNPLYLKAKARPYCCGPEFLLFEAQEIERFRMGAEEKRLLIEASVRSREPVICMYFLTAEEIPEPLAGHGDMYAFCFDSESLLLATDVSSWRS